MADSAPQRSPRGRRTGVAFAVLAGCVLAGLLLKGHPTEAQEIAPASDFPSQIPLELDLHFEQLEASRKLDHVEITYEIAAGDWQRLDEQNIALFISMWIPNEGPAGTFAYSYHMPLDARSGTVEFPSWLSTLQADKVGLCPLGARPWDNVGLGRGYVCDAMYVAPLARNTDQQAQPVDFAMTYYGGMPYYGFFPWRGPYL